MSLALKSKWTSALLLHAQTHGITLVSGLPEPQIWSRGKALGIFVYFACTTAAPGPHFENDWLKLLFLSECLTLQVYYY